MTRRKFLVAALAVMVLTVSTVSVAYAAGGRFVAKFDATAGIGAVGPAHIIGGIIGDPFLASMQATTDIEVRANRNGVVKKITVTTVNEAVLNGGAPLLDPLGNPIIDPISGDPIVVGDTLVGGCTSPQPDTVACDAVRALLDGSGILSLHTSTANLTRVDDVGIPLFIVAPSHLFLARWTTLGLSDPGILHAYSGKLRGSLEGAFLVQSPVSALPLEGAVALKIRGTATYQCFEPDGFQPLPNAAYCETGTPERAEIDLAIANGLTAPGQPLFLPSTLNVVDKGKFIVQPDPETVTIGDLWLKKMKGKLKVTVNATGGVIQAGSGIELTKGKAVFKTFDAPPPPEPDGDDDHHDHDGDDDDDHGGHDQDDDDHGNDDHGDDDD